MSVDITHISVFVAQLPISLDIEENLDTILSLLEHAEKEDLVILPDGRVLWEVTSPAVEFKRCVLDLSEVSNWYLSQSRDDIVSGSAATKRRRRT